jgi:hypothetical protein
MKGPSPVVIMMRLNFCHLLHALITITLCRHTIILCRHQITHSRGMAGQIITEAQTGERRKDLLGSIISCNERNRLKSIWNHVAPISHPMSGNLVKDLDYVRNAWDAPIHVGKHAQLIPRGGLHCLREIFFVHAPVGPSRSILETPYSVLSMYREFP